MINYQLVKSLIVNGEVSTKETYVLGYELQVGVKYERSVMCIIIV